ncbi:hypothetical protein ASPCAL02508 [Aspergillus calidoustus]|uniref:Uncharacterized protein n=1 Tax=Aspergillus calidoustus TaxID=454130 RepID=A0A0U5GLV9_ASPCI|nr:hypothetical protein ASPCAL02508 [Aspergillus calidoustus]
MQTSSIDVLHRVQGHVAFRCMTLTRQPQVKRGEQLNGNRRIIVPSWKRRVLEPVFDDAECPRAVQPPRRDCY